jgi:hypothetical protein
MGLTVFGFIFQLSDQGIDEKIYKTLLEHIRRWTKHSIQRDLKEK